LYIVYKVGSGCTWVYLG